MRKLFYAVVFLVVTCLVFSCATAEETFVFRKGIQFGDSMDSIREKEKDSGVLSEDEGHLYYTEKELSGIRNSSITYFFEDNGLKAITISYDTNMSSAKAEKDYQVINEGLIRKYGDPLEQEMINPYPGGLFDRAEPIFTDSRISRQVIYGKDQWIVPIEGGKKLVIEHMALSYYAFLTNVLHCVDYQYLEPGQDLNDIIDNDL